MLLPRVITAVVLAAVFLLSLYSASPLAFIAFVYVGVIAAIWEWAGLSGITTAMRWLYSAVFLIAASAAAVMIYTSAPIDWMPGLKLLLAIDMVLWVLMLALVLSFPRIFAVLLKPIARMIYGVVALGSLWLALLYLRIHPSGQFWLLYLVFIVAASDIGAYFSGKRFGRRKLAPAVSPGKSWEGFIGGLLSAQLLAMLFYCLQPGEANINLAEFLFVALLMSGLSVLGDLTESVMKRVANKKDSGSILPGHGGVLDRIDGLMPVAPLFVLASLYLGW